jgi:hypothetical protein
MTDQTRILGADALAGEPPLGDVLSDPIVHAVMARDGVTPSDLRTLLARWQGRSRPSALRGAPASRAA